MTTTIKNQTFGFEMEFYGMTRMKAAQVVQKVVGGNVYHRGIRNEEVISDGRKWQIVYDGSISNTRGEQCELVSPICNYEDIETIQEIVRALREAGAGVNESCGIHIHVGADQHTAKSLKNLVNMMYSKQDILYRALDMHESRAEKWAKKIQESRVNRFKKKMETLNEVGRAWYNSNPSEHQTKYDSSRYHGLNLHSVFFKGTVEFRLFNSTTHAGRAKAYIQFCLALSAAAINARSAAAKITTSDREKYTMRAWLQRMGLNGEEFQTCRDHMLKNLEDSYDWRSQYSNAE